MHCLRAHLVRLQVFDYGSSTQLPTATPRILPGPSASSAGDLAACRHYDSLDLWDPLISQGMFRVASALDLPRTHSTRPYSTK